MIHKEEIPDSMLFAGIHPEEKESILKCLSAVEKKYEKGDIIFLAGTEIRSMGFILSGRVEISRDDFWGNRQVLGHGETGELFGEAYACMPGEVLMVNVVAAEKSRILFLDLGRILNVCTPACSHHNRLIHNLLYIMAEEKPYADAKDRPHGAEVHPGKGDGRTCPLSLKNRRKRPSESPLTASSSRIISRWTGAHCLRSSPG